MHRKLVSEYSNQLHQLLVSVSRHYYFGNDGYLRYQKKPMDVDLKNSFKSRKEHLVYYILRDHYSGTFAFRIASTKRLLPLADFLYYAWSEEKTEEKFIYGMPDALFVPKTVATDGLFTALENLDIMPLHPPSGFASGVRIFRDIEQLLSYYLSETVDHRLDGVDKLCSKVCQYLIDSGKLFEKWKESLPREQHPRSVPAYDDFIKLFNTVDAGPFSLVQGENRRNDNTILELKLPPFDREKLDRAQEMIYDAWEEMSRSKRLSIARKALLLSPYCTDAYNLLAEHSESSEERMELYERGVKVGRQVLGDSFFEENAGDFWGITKTRPYMRALAGLAECLWDNGHRQDAIASCRELLRLNPNDSLGIRYTLVNYLLAEGMNNEADEFLSEHNEATCFMLYSEALLSFRCKSARKAAISLNKALEANSFVPAYLVGVKYIPHIVPETYSRGSEEEAIIYASASLSAWRVTPSALDWLATRANYQRVRRNS
ncbi:MULTISPECIES: hypothetical protein [Paenibacillaceae]|uniref:Tetratricopeptide repeat protein n=1 Tax=Paenibacillus chartarius TaxID=747481 RepID=A0ABV6DL15_9BACL|nr:hypothetical protein [Cohnella massiliensis]